MSRRPLATAGVVVLAGLVTLPSGGCGPQATGTKTNWLQTCSADADCHDAGSCLCGICSTVCTDDEACVEGTCGSLVQSAGQCAGDGSRRICLPESATECSTLL